MNTSIDIKSNEYARHEEEDNIQYIMRICKMKDVRGLSYNDVARIVSQYTNREYTGSGIRKLYNRNTYGSESVCNGEKNAENLNDLGIQIDTETLQYRDIKMQLSALYRRISREESIKQIAHEYAETMNKSLFLAQGEAEKNLVHDSEGILLLSDWHYGISFDNYWGSFNPDIVKKRLEDLYFNVSYYVRALNLKKVNVLNLGDLIAGRIHLKIRLQSRIDAITQIMDVSELMAQFLARLSNITEVVYYSCSDNHSRIEPNKQDSLDLESLTRITDWYLKERLSEITIIDNIYGDDIISFNCLGHKIAAVHGHKDKQNAVVSNLTLMTKTHYDLICTAHEHHFSCDEKNETVVVSNPSLMGTDDYAKDLRLCASPAQVLIIASKNNVTESIHRIKLN